MAAEVEVSRSPGATRPRWRRVLLVLAWVGFFVPLIWVVSPAFSFAEYPLRTGPLVAGVTCLAIGLWLFYRSHADLGTNWSVTLEVRRGASTYYAGRVSRDPPSDVLGASPLFRRPGPGDPELGGGSLERDRVRGPPCASCRRGGENDGRAIWRTNTRRTRHGRSVLFLGVW